MKTLYIISLEPLPSRYTIEWFSDIPNMFNEQIKSKNLVNEWQVIQINGEVNNADETTSGAFLNFTNTNIWKSQQLIKIAELFQKNLVKDGDHFLFTDAWNTSILSLKYMIELSELNVKISGLWHAGSYDNFDLLGQKIKDKHWSYNTERALFYAIDHNIFATEFHIELFGSTILRNDGWISGMYSEINVNLFGNNKILRIGQPHYSLINHLSNLPKKEKENIILFPHRISPEKQLDIFLDLKESMPEFEFVVCQQNKLTKSEYHDLLLRAKVTFSASLQETLGISSNIESPITHTIPINPNRLSYTEMFKDYPEFLYPSFWTLNFDNYIENKDKMMLFIRDKMYNYESYIPRLNQYTSHMIDNYSTCQPMFDKLLEI